MLYLKCTSVVLKAVGLKKDNLAPPGTTEAPLGNWYLNRFDVDGHNVYIFMSEPTLLSFVLFQGQKPVTVQSLPNMFLAGLQQLLEMRGLPSDSIERALLHYETGVFTQTDSRSTLGSLNELVHYYRYMIESQGGLASCDLTEIIMKINGMPQRKLDWHNSWDITQAKLALIC